MTEQPDFWLDHPPVWELGLSVQTQSNGVLDAYSVRAAHDLFRKNLPVVERHEPVWLSGLQTQQLGPEDALYRWWFMSPDGEHLVQLQENLIARNWRRRQLPPALPHAYPGFHNTFAAFKADVDTMRTLATTDFPDPLVCELLYDNFLRLTTPEGEDLRTQDIFAPINFPAGTKRSALIMSWNEELEGAPADSTFKVQAGVHHMSLKDEAPVPVVRLNLSARSGIGDWEGVFRFFELAHATVRQRFLDLTTERAHTMWGLK